MRTSLWVVVVGLLVGSWTGLAWAMPEAEAPTCPTPTVALPVDPGGGEQDEGSGDVEAGELDLDLPERDIREMTPCKWCGTQREGCLSSCPPGTCGECCAACWDAYFHCWETCTGPLV